MYLLGAKLPLPRHLGATIMAGALIPGIIVDDCKFVLRFMWSCLFILQLSKWILEDWKSEEV